MGRGAASMALNCAIFAFVFTAATVSLVTGEVSQSILEADNRPIILFDTFGFESSGHIDLNLTETEVLVPEKAEPADRSQMGFCITTVDNELEVQSDFESGNCILNNAHIHRLFTLDDVELKQDENGLFKFRYTVPEAKEYSLFFVNCLKRVRVSMNITFALYNIEANGKLDYLPGGKTQLPLLYFIFFLAYLAAAVTWVVICMSHKDTTHRIHILMGILVCFKAFTVLSKAGEFAYIKATGAPQGWNIAFYIFSFFRGVMLFTVIVLIGTGWSFLKPFLQDKEKQIILIVIPLQVFANIASIILDESGPSSQSWFTWRDIFYLLDFICCLAIVFPIVWSIRHLREASHTDGKAARIATKLTLFRHFYVLVVCYIYFTRFLVYLVRSTMPFQFSWTADLSSELATLTFYCVTGYFFRPVDNNPYLEVEEEMEIPTVEDPEAKALKSDDGEFDL